MTRFRVEWCMYRSGRWSKTRIFVQSGHDTTMPTAESADEVKLRYTRALALVFPHQRYSIKFFDVAVTPFVGAFTMLGETRP